MDVQRSKRLIHLMVSIALLTSAASAALTPTSHQTLAPTPHLHNTTDSALTSNTLLIPAAQQNPLLYSLGAQLLQPDALNQQETTSSCPAIRSLPAAPAAILLALVGASLVLCVDNRSRLIAGCAALAVLGHSGIRLLPNLVHRDHARPSQSPHACCRHTIDLHSHTLAPTPTETVLGYLGLLHRLAGSPDPAAPNPLPTLPAPPTPSQYSPNQRLAIMPRFFIAACHSLSHLTPLLAFGEDANERPLIGRIVFASWRSSTDAFLAHTLSRAPPLA